MWRRRGRKRAGGGSDLRRRPAWVRVTDGLCAHCRAVLTQRPARHPSVPVRSPPSARPSRCAHTLFICAVQNHSVRRRIATAITLLALVGACSSSGRTNSTRQGPGTTGTGSGTVGSSAGGSTVPREGIHKIAHVVVIMQENRSFVSYFGTYPGADGIPKNVCVP